MIEDHLQWMALENAMYETSFPKADAIFCHGWGDLHDELIEFVARAHKQSGAKYIVLNSEREYQVGDPGFEYWKQRLVETYGVEESVVVGAGPGKQTKEEAHWFAHFAKTNGVSSAILVSVPAHIMRAFLTNIAVFEKQQTNTKLYPRTIRGVNWEEQILIRGLVGPQPDEKTNRLGRLVAECARIVNYRQEYEKGNPDFCIATIFEGLEYLKKTL